MISIGELSLYSDSELKLRLVLNDDLKSEKQNVHLELRHKIGTERQKENICLRKSGNTLALVVRYMRSIALAQN